MSLAFDAAVPPAGGDYFRYVTDGVFYGAVTSMRRLAGEHVLPTGRPPAVGTITRASWSTVDPSRDVRT